MTQLTTKIFIDGGIPDETKLALKQFQIHFSRPLDGQTTNPSLIAKNLKMRISTNLTPQIATDEYKKIVEELSSILPQGSISIQVFANQTTKAEEMIVQAKDRITWIPNASIKLPCTSEGLKAAEIICTTMPINITLVFSQAQAAAVYEATRHANYPVFLSPFVGRIDDLGGNGMDLIANILKMYDAGDHHVEVLTASVRSTDHILQAIHLGSQIITLPFKAFEPWANAGFPLPDASFSYTPSLQPLPYNDEIALGNQWASYDLTHELTTKGLELFWNDWSGLFS